VKRDNWWAQYFGFGMLLGAAILLIASYCIGVWSGRQYEREARLMRDQTMLLYESVEKLNEMTGGEDERESTGSD